MRDVRPSLIARVKVGLHPTKNGSEKTLHLESVAHFLKWGKCTWEYLSMSRDAVVYIPSLVCTMSIYTCIHGLLFSHLRPRHCSNCYYWCYYPAQSWHKYANSPQAMYVHFCSSSQCMHSDIFILCLHGLSYYTSKWKIQLMSPHYNVLPEAVCVL